MTARNYGLGHWLVNGKSITLAKPRKRMSWKVKEYLIWAVLIFVAIVAVVVFGGNVK